MKPLVVITITAALGAAGSANAQQAPAGPLTDRVWVIHRDGSENRRLYSRNIERKEWITHESWIPGTRELAFVDWPHGVRCVHVDCDAGVIHAALAFEQVQPVGCGRGVGHLGGAAS